MGTETKGPSLVFIHSDEYFLDAETWGQKQKDRPFRVSDNKNIKISLKAQAHLSGLNDCKHTGKYKTLYAFSAFVQ